MNDVLIVIWTHGGEKLYLFLTRIKNPLSKVVKKLEIGDANDKIWEKYLKNKDAPTNQS